MVKVRNNGGQIRVAGFVFEPGTTELSNADFKKASEVKVGPKLYIDALVADGRFEVTHSAPAPRRAPRPPVEAPVAAPEPTEEPAPEKPRIRRRRRK